MPNHCYNKVSVKGNPSVIRGIINTQCSFKELYPLDDYSSESWEAHYGVRGKSWDFELIKQSEDALIFNMTTAWNPPIDFFEALINKYNMWLKCEWYEEGGLAGIFIGDKIERKELVWEDWCIEELAMLS